MPEPKNAFDEIEDDIEARAIAEAEAEIDSGKGVPHAKVQEWLLNGRRAKSYRLRASNLVAGLASLHRPHLSLDMACAHCDAGIESVVPAKAGTQGGRSCGE
jgi:hypothetical protein